MEVDSNSHVSFLSLLMAPDESIPTFDQYYDITPHNNDDDPIRSFPSSSHHDFSLQQPKNTLTASPSFHVYDDCYNIHNQNFGYDQKSECDPSLLFSTDYCNGDGDGLAKTDYNTQFVPPLPNLLSLESFTPPLQQPQQQQGKDDYTLGSIVASFQPSSTQQKNIQRRNNKNNRRQSRISERVYKLGKLLPGGHRHRKCTADMLEEAHKYIKFLQAQVRVLKSMPTESPPPSFWWWLSDGCGDINGQSGAAALARLSRQQLLQVVVNSPAAQVVLADNGWCLFSAEQVETIKRAQARQNLVNQLLSNLPL